MINSDGSFGVNTKTITFTNTSKSIIDWLMIYAPLCGYTASYGGVSHNTSIENSVYRVYLLDTSYTLNNDSRNPDSKVVISYKEEDVYCVTVSTGLIMVRGTNGVTSICGNCAMLEHGTVYLFLNNEGTLVVEDRDRCAHMTELSHNKHSVSKWMEDGLYITTNYRVIVENDWLDVLKYQCEPTKFHEKRVTVHFTTQIAITREFNRHRVNSMAEQSTRYCNFGKDKFGGVGINIPIGLLNIKGTEKWLEHADINEVAQDLDEEYKGESTSGITPKQWTGFNWWIFSNYICEKAYLNMLQLGWTPQEARVVLPLDTNSQLSHTAFVSDWKHFFNLRCDKTAHPDARALAIPLEQRFKKNGWIE